MVIRKQPIISLLLDPDYQFNPAHLGVPDLENRIHFRYLMDGFNSLMEVWKTKPEWGLPELLMPSFEAVMKKSAKSFLSIDHQLFKEFYDDEVCGILLTKDFGTIIYGFAENRLYVWLFRTEYGVSRLYNYFYVDSTEDNERKVYCWPTLTSDPQLYNTDSDDLNEFYSILTNKLIIYLAVKKYAKVETIEVPVSKITNIKDTINGQIFKEKIRNESGQLVIVMDSRWFTRIINNNDIFVRGFFRLQNKKNERGEWYKELIFVDSFVRHGYHRNARIENAEEVTENKGNEEEEGDLQQ